MGLTELPPYIPVKLVEPVLPHPNGVLWSTRIGNIRQSNDPNLRKSDKSIAAFYGNLFNGPIVTPILNKLLRDKLSESSSRDLYA